jgi:hypothetical protein
VLCGREAGERLLHVDFVHEILEAMKPRAILPLIVVLFVFNRAINGLDCRLQLDEPRAGVLRLFTLKRRSDDLCKRAAVFNQMFTGLFQECGVLLAHDHLILRIRGK